MFIAYMKANWNCKGIVVELIEMKKISEGSWLLEIIRRTDLIWNILWRNVFENINMEGGWNGFILAFIISLSFNFEDFLRLFVTVKFRFNF
jgi:hypothetical protein